MRLEKAPKLEIPPESDRNALKRAITVTVESVSSPACQALGALSLKRGKKDEALNWFHRAIEFNPGNPAPYLELGKLYLEMNDREKAEEHFKRYLAAGGDEAKLKEIRHQYLSAERARRELGWQPQFTLRDGLQRTIRWYQDFFA